MIIKNIGESFNQVPLKIKGQNVLINNLNPQSFDDDGHPDTPNIMDAQTVLEDINDQLKTRTSQLKDIEAAVTSNSSRITQLEIETGQTPKTVNPNKIIISNVHGQITTTQGAVDADAEKLNGLAVTLNRNFNGATLADILYTYLSTEGGNSFNKTIITQATNENINYYTTPGVFVFAGSNPINAPSDTASEGGTLIVFSQGASVQYGTQFKQLWFTTLNHSGDSKSHYMYERSTDTGTDGWNTWVRYLTTADLQSNRHVITTRNMDLSRDGVFKEEGTYYFSSDYTPIDAPPGTKTGNLIVILQAAQLGTWGCKQLWLNSYYPKDENYKQNSYDIWERSWWFQAGQTIEDERYGWTDWVLITNNFSSNIFTISSLESPANPSTLTFTTIGLDTTDNNKPTPHDASIYCYDASSVNKQGAFYTSSDMVILPHGNMIVGSGESPYYLYNYQQHLQELYPQNNNAWATTGFNKQSLHLSSDFFVNIHTYCNDTDTVEKFQQNQKQWTFDRYGNLFLPNSSYYNVSSEVDTKNNEDNPRLCADGNLYLNVAAEGTTPAIKGRLSRILNNKQNKINVTTGRVLISNSNGEVAASTTPSSKLAFLNNVTQDIQAQINSITNVPLAKVNEAGLTKIVNALNISSFNANDPVALSAHQGYKLSQSINTTNSALSTHQDTKGNSTTYGHVKVINNLSSSQYNGVALSAAQGKALYQQINNSYTTMQGITSTLSNNITTINTKIATINSNISDLEETKPKGYQVVTNAILNTNSEVVPGSGEKVPLVWTNNDIIGVAYKVNKTDQQDHAKIEFVNHGTYLLISQITMRASSEAGTAATVNLQYRNWDSSSNSWSTTYKNCGTYSISSGTYPGYVTLTDTQIITTQATNNGTKSLLFFVCTNKNNTSAIPAANVKNVKMTFIRLY